mmetsp:Transcript_13951/g.58707  ORF Transcript_13951/g.58707 Transcript_13951/m.58707 type:complete len:301 (-) Transcript_13951:536-1438(-)
MLDAMASARARMDVVGNGAAAPSAYGFSGFSGTAFTEIPRSSPAAFSASSRSFDTSSARSASCRSFDAISIVTCARLSFGIASAAQLLSRQNARRAESAVSAESSRFSGGVRVCASASESPRLGIGFGGSNGAPCSSFGQRAQLQTKPYRSSNAARRWLVQSPASTYACVSSSPKRSSETAQRNSWIHVGPSVVDTSSVVFLRVSRRYDATHVGAHEWFSSAPRGKTAAAMGSGSPPVHRWMKKSLTREREISARAAASVTDLGMSPTARADAICVLAHSTSSSPVKSQTSALLSFRRAP